MASRWFFFLVKNEEGAGLLLLSLADVFPWVRFLPQDDVRAFLVELVETLRAAASVSNLAAVDPAVAAWKATAEIHPDPELTKAATAPRDGTASGRATAGEAGQAPRACT